MARGTQHRPGALAADQQRLYDVLAGGARASMPGGQSLAGDDGVLRGPFNAMLHSPAVGDALQGLGVAVRSASRLDPRVRELVILVVARHLDSPVEWNGHARIARALGVPESAIADIEAECDDVRLPAEYADSGACALALARALLRDQPFAASATTYDQTIDELGEAGAFEVITVVGYYWTLAQQMVFFDVTE